ncbi:DUF1003 domain-containing protein [Leucobacter massiliensis]|uniref:DUF1003 domain-containing protein n=1 Tax=Leucobacter massiliensis TaxID=1686285 RepID=A0A2S9QML1_9MICO|nr:DUF1003 domain-containing protein [Leucobacter massiliensis]PRI10826.1 hypothetical protein B4915_07985 [Leucobacter massiliensis]
MSIFGRFRRDTGLDAPRGGRTPKAGETGGGLRAGGNERFGRWSEGIARGMGTPWFLILLSVFCVVWLVWNTVSPEPLRFDSAALGFTALTLILSLQASYAAPLILLAQNRQDDRDRVQIEQDRQRAERNLADTEFLAREVVALRLAIKELPDRDVLRQELRSLLAEFAEEQRESELAAAEAAAHADGSADATGAAASPGAAAAQGAAPEVDETRSAPAGPGADPSAEPGADPADRA